MAIFCWNVKWSIVEQRRYQFYYLTTLIHKHIKVRPHYSCSCDSLCSRVMWTIWQVTREAIRAARANGTDLYHREQFGPRKHYSKCAVRVKGLSERRLDTVARNVIHNELTGRLKFNTRVGRLKFKYSPNKKKQNNRSEMNPTYSLIKLFPCVK
jgi:hypothetical protein